ncbi:DUF6445 family protein [Gandjariella thermophila]|uniref:Uncharacterized protein n=1 Tax=Gandjariella thermophila TaxID=1931992 RepID=A0A4D4JEK4_9PSEU|nr:DUF6445 family protein [Gandjariella thermophila]GDY33852.1 hypothetical protein GTS_54850 [Gandjariella thermophila]
MSETSYIVYDDFYRDPISVRDLALRSSWLDPKISDGREYSRETEKGYYTDAIVDKLARIVGRRIVFDAKRMGFGVFAFYPASAAVDVSTHFDDTSWSGIVYLMPDELNRTNSGLAFYRHRESGLTGPPDDEQARELGYADSQTWIQEVYYRDKLTPEAWQRTSFVGARFNRLVLLNGARLFHRASDGFGTTAADARLTQRFFFDIDDTEVDA